MVVILKGWTVPSSSWATQTPNRYVGGYSIYAVDVAADSRSQKNFRAEIAVTKLKISGLVSEP